MSTIKSSAEDLTLNADGSGNDVIIQSDGSTKVTVDDGGRVLVGKSTGVANVGAELRNGVSDYALLGTSSSGTPLILNRTTSDGEIAKFRKDNTDVGRMNVTASGISIYLGGNAPANELDDYEAGTFQPSFVTGSGSITAHASYSLCRYTKIGRMVQIQGLISTSGVSSPSGSMQIHGLPFAVDNNTSGESSGNAALAIAGIVDLDSAINVLTMRPEAGTSYITVEEFNGTGTSDVADKWKTGTYFRFSGTYTT